ncbi:MAG: DMT family transporter [Myxococcota bacterium]|jgi:drug/metabolite transporter (DMT)-like permease
MQPLKPGQAHALMHLTVFVWGFTAILGRLISISALTLVWYRIVLVVLVMGGLVAVRKLGFAVPVALLRRFALVGAFVALHWLLFYGCIKHAGVAVAVLCLSTITFFTALFEPLVFKRAVAPIELLVGLFVMGGVALLVKVEAGADFLGLALGLGSALFSAAFGVLNGQLAREARAEVTTFYELSSAVLVTSLLFLVWPGDFVAPGALSARDVGLLLALAVGCTVLPWLWSLRVLKTLSPYTLALAVNLEPVYAMVLAYVLFPGEEQLTWRFYGGAGVLVGLVAVNTWLTRAPAAAPRPTRGDQAKP